VLFNKGEVSNDSCVQFIEVNWFSDIINTAGIKSFNFVNRVSEGMGLLLSRDFVEIQGGKIRVESEPNLGTTISFTLPAHVK